MVNNDALDQVINDLKSQKILYYSMKSKKYALFDITTVKSPYPSIYAVTRICC